MMMMMINGQKHTYLAHPSSCPVQLITYKNSLYAPCPKKESTIYYK